MNKEHRERLKFYKKSWPNLDPQQLEIAAFYFEMCESLARKLGQEFPSAHIFFVDGLEKPGTYSKTSTGHRYITIEPNHTIDEMRGIVCHELAHQYMEITERHCLSMCVISISGIKGHTRKVDFQDTDVVT